MPKIGGVRLSQLRYIAIFFVERENEINKFSIVYKNIKYFLSII